MNVDLAHFGDFSLTACSSSVARSWAACKVNEGSTSRSRLTCTRPLTSKLVTSCTLKFVAVGYGAHSRHRSSVAGGRGVAWTTTSAVRKEFANLRFRRLHHGLRVFEGNVSRKGRSQVYKELLAALANPNALRLHVSQDLCEPGGDAIGRALGFGVHQGVYGALAQPHADVEGDAGHS